MVDNTETPLQSGLTMDFQPASPVGTALPRGDMALPPSGYQISLQVLDSGFLPSKIVCERTRMCLRARLLGGSCTICTLMPSCVINMCIQRVINQSQWLRFQFLFLTQQSCQAPPALGKVNVLSVCLSVCVYSCLLFPRAASGLCSGTKELCDRSFACHDSPSHSSLLT